MHSTLRRLSANSGIVAAIIGTIALCGWVLDIAVFKSIVPGIRAMNPLVAVHIIVLGISLWLIHRTSLLVTSVVRISAATSILLGVVKLLEYIGVLPIGIDMLLFPQQTPSNPISAFTAVACIMAGVGLLTFNIEMRSKRMPAQIIGLFVLSTAMLVLINYAFTLLAFHPPTERYISMPLITALAFICLGLGLLCAHPHKGLMAIVTAPHSGGYILRRLLPVIVGLPFVAGWLRVAGYNAGLYSMEAGASMYAMATIGIIGVILWYTAKSLNHADEERSIAEDALYAANQRLMQTNIDLKAANELKSDLLNIAAHDMKNPLGAIRTMADMIRSYPEDRDTAEEMAGLIHESANHILHLIDELLRTAALESGKLQLSKDIVDMNTLVDIVVASNTQQAEKKHQHIHVDMDADCSVEGDFSRLREAIDNIVSNAVKYSHEGAGIYVSLLQRNSCVRFAVRDEGQGMSEADMKKLFGKFQRLSARPTGNESSTGLGLSIVKQLIELHCGQVWAESPGQGQGTTFYIELPLAAQPHDTEKLSSTTEHTP